MWPDEWTVVTKDGKRSAQFEHTVLVTETGHEILTARTEKSYKFWFLSDDGCADAKKKPVDGGKEEGEEGEGGKESKP